MPKPINEIEKPLMDFAQTVLNNKQFHPTGPKTREYIRLLALFYYDCRVNGLVDTGYTLDELKRFDTIH